MKHASTQALFDYWNRRRGRRWAPARSEIDPADIRHVLGDTFLLASDFVDDLRFRLGGTRVCALFVREIKGETFADLWSETSRAQIEDLLTVVLDEKVGVVAGVLGRTESGAEVGLELLLLPLAFDGRSRVRALGVLAPLTPPYWLGEQPVIDLNLRTLRHIGPKQSNFRAPLFGQTNERPRTRHGFLVYSGGLESDGKLPG
ncbi:MAG: PAS domain-containing protein [Pseudolabrys sp.]|jgi:hypothetical protein